MSTAVDICNLALARLGDEAGLTSISIPYESAQAQHCALFYPNALSELIDQHNWSFCIKTVALVATTNPDPRWLYCYTLPTDFNNVIGVYDSLVSATYYGQFDNNLSIVQKDYSIGTNNAGVQVLYSNQIDAAIEYSILITDPALLSPIIRNALVWLLASYLAGPILKGNEGVSAGLKLLQGYQTALKAAKELDCQDRSVAMAYIPSGIAARA